MYRDLAVRAVRTVRARPRQTVGPSVPGNDRAQWWHVPWVYLGSRRRPQLVPSDREPDDLYVIYWCEENGFAGSCDFVYADSLEDARERSKYGSGSVAHQRLIFEGTYDEFREHVHEELDDESREPRRFSIEWG